VQTSVVSLVLCSLSTGDLMYEEPSILKIFF
jgi:hypothetical protein